MAASQPFLVVKLSEKDVPGASLVENSVEEHNVTQLKRWLKCRKQNIRGKKTELIERVKSCIQNNVDIDSQIDSGKWLKLKEKIKRLTLLSPTAKLPEYPTTWNTFPSAQIPQLFNRGCIFDYLFSYTMMDIELQEIQSTITTTSKPLTRGEVYLKSGNVQHLMDGFSTDKKIYFVKCEVKASYRDFYYNVKVMLDCETCKIIDGQCHCKCSSMGRCSHIAALLYALEDYVNSADKENASCTSKLCLWNQGRKRKEPHRADELQYSNKKSHSARCSFNPVSVSSPVNDDHLATKFLIDLQQYNTTNNEESIWKIMLRHQYNDYELTLVAKSLLRSQVFKLRRALTEGYQGPVNLTGSDQTSSSKWWRYRKILVTASMIKDIMNPKTGEQLFNLVKRHMWDDQNLNSPYLEYGRINEENARQQYIELREPEGFRVEETGLWLNSHYPGVGASPDGLVYDPNETCPLGVLEIKCPKVLENSRPTDLSALTSKQQSSFCCELNHVGGLSLKHSHKYFYQVQVQMAITERSWCDFTVWTPQGLHIERVRFNKDFAIYILKKASLFQQNILAPKYFEMRIPRLLNPFDLTKDE